MSNDKKNDNVIPMGERGVKFDSNYQPSPEAKSKGWDRRRAKQEIMDKITDIRSMNMQEITELQKDIKLHPEKHTLLEVKLVQYLSKEKFTTDFLDRNIGKAPQDIDITTQGEKITNAVVKFIDDKDEIRDKGDKDTTKDS